MKQVAAAVATFERRVLIAKRAAGQVLEGYWEFPGGKIEQDETAQDCIVRELAEELGVSSTAGDVIVRSTYRYPGGAIELIAVHVSLDSMSFTLSVHDEVAWASSEELLGFNLAPADVPIAQTIFSLL